ncbi:NlpC/P60 family protein [Hoeflea sp. TYP-13]|uniref:C40 family peptidase n=1 Tax=Hoeflea sp. TYP-13 TaxID=3230023 RepID=UPI0034C5E5FC
MTGALDKKLNAYRPDLADAALKGQVEAKRYVTGRRRQVVTPVLDLRDGPNDKAGVDTQALLGETVTVFDEDSGWSWIQLEADNYVGYARSDGLGDVQAPATHIVTVPRTFIYSSSDLRSPVRLACSIGSRLALTGSQTTRGTEYLLLEDGTAVIARHVAPITHRFLDYVDVAAAFLQTPYLWGGRSGFGVDCSGLVQLCMELCGHNVPRDTYMQEAGLGEPIEPDAKYANLERGDLVFWKGHVAIVEEPQTALHASGHTMQVVREPLYQAIERIERLYGSPTSVRKP